jgi:NADH dehydrogenase
MNSPVPHQILILGAGFGGLRTALELEKRRARLGPCQVTLVDKRSEHIYTPLLYEVSTGELHDNKKFCVGDLCSGVAVHLDAYPKILRSKRLRFKRGEVVSVSQEQKRVLLKDGTSLPFDDLVIALGTETSSFGVPGVPEHALFMKCLADAFRIRQRLAEFLQAYVEGKEKRIEIVIGGAGPTGTETAAELGNFFQRLEKNGIVKRGAYEIVLVEAGPDILGMYPESFRSRAKARLKHLGVKIMPNTRVLEVEKKSVVTSAGEMNADVTIWSGGVRPLDLVKKLGVPTDEKGWIPVEMTMAVRDRENIWAVGDTASAIDPKTGKRTPLLAQAAAKEAAVVAENMTRHLERKPPITFHPPAHWITDVPLGGAYAIADFGSWHLGGRLGYFVRKAADLFYFFSILPFGRAFRMWSKGTRVYMKND